MKAVSKSKTSPSQEQEEPRLRIAFVHPDLGIGGAERLVVDAAAGLQERGHFVRIYTSHHDPSHAFPETIGTSSSSTPLLKVQVRGDFLPSSILGGKGFILCAILRNIYLAICLLLEMTFVTGQAYDVIFVDQLSVCIPLLRLSPSAKIFFYCHYPDKLLSRRNSLLKRLYRMPIDMLEEFTTKMADSIVVNSKFTASVFRKSFPWIWKSPKVIYPGINLSSYDITITSAHPSVKDWSHMIEDHAFILSINRFERKKDVELAIRAFAQLKRRSDFDQLKLVLAGGYDSRVSENVEYQRELDRLAQSLGLATSVLNPSAIVRKEGDESSLISNPKSGLPKNEANVLFLLSFTIPQRNYLLSRAKCMVYTPSHEHFGIVPVEAMYCGLPVIAVENGGPTESIRHGVTGWLCPAEPGPFAEAMERCLSPCALTSFNINPEKSSITADKQHLRDHVLAHFSKSKFVDGLELEMARMHGPHADVEGLLTWYALVLLPLSIFPLAIVYTCM